MISLIWDKRAIPLYWQLLDKRGSSNIAEQQSLITPILALLKDYKIIILGDREFGSVKLGSWLCEQDVKFVLRVKQERYIQQESAEYTHLSELGLLPGASFFITGVKVTKQKGFGLFNVAGYWRRKSKGKVEDEGWYLLTNLGRLFRTYCANFLGKCQKSKARISKFIKFLNPKPHLFKSFNLVLIPSTIPLVVLDSKYPPISPNHLLIVSTLFL